jgi:hypothetical protein
MFHYGLKVFFGVKDKMIVRYGLRIYQVRHILVLGSNFEALLAIQ